MAITSIVRAMGGDSLREVQLSEIKILDFRVFPLFLPDERWIKAVAVYYEELSLFLASVRLDLHLPEEFFVPDLWDIVTKLPAQESEMLRDVWSLGHDLASSAGWKRAVTEVPLTRNGVGGTIYIKQ
jgi:hypothetical protein